MTVSYQLIAGITGSVKAVRRTEPDQTDLCIPFDPGQHRLSRISRMASRRQRTTTR